MIDIRHVKPPAPPEQFEYKNVKQGEFWRHIPAYKDVDEATFLDHLWQQKNAVKSAPELLATIKDVCSPEFFADAEAGFARAPMAVRVSPYAISLIDWNDPVDDPIRRQFVPLASSLLPDHPRLTLDSLHEQDDSPVPGLVHRYVDKALFLPLNTCPVYCRFCTRSYAIGPDTENVDKVGLAKTPKQWDDAFKYIAERPELEDIVISGGDTYQLPPKNIELIGNALLDIPHVRRMRFATKGPAIMPMKIITHKEWLDAITSIVDRGRKMGKEVVLHTHFNAPEEVTWITEKAMAMLFERGIFTRNQSVLIRGVNDTRERMQLLVKRLGNMNVHAYYVYMHDMVKGRRRVAHDDPHGDRHREVRSRQHRRVQHADVRVRRTGRRRQARRSLVRILRSRKRHRRLRGSEREAGQSFPLLRSHRQALGQRASALDRPRDARADDRGSGSPRRRRQRRARARLGMGEDGRLRIDLFITICAVAIAAIASGASVYQSYVIRQQYDSAVWPYLSFVVSRDPAQASFVEADLRNDGLGPALIRSAVVTVDGKPVASVDAAVAPLMHDAVLSQRHAPHPTKLE